ncbi:MAG TPA: hypothetical protein VFV90_06235 [Usitatibacter sp.]|nr:hypothetical protein [Usitatibacter sp.]
MPPDLDPARLEVLRDIPPLMPMFLVRRRVGTPAVAPVLEQLGIERLLLFKLIHIYAISGSYNGAAVTLSQVRAWNPYIVIDDDSEPVAELLHRGLLREDAEGALSLSPEAVAAVERVHTGSSAYVAGREVLPRNTLQALADQLRRAVDALTEHPTAAPRPGSHLAGALWVQRQSDLTRPMSAIEAYMSDLWGARDDAHMAAWREAGMEGPALDLLTQVWQGAATVDDIAAKLEGRQTRGDVESSLAWLVTEEYVTLDGDSVALTPTGVMKREDIERETDRIYFTHWPHTYEEAAFVRDTLRDVVDKLGPPS